MKLENQVCTLEQAKRLKELGIEQNSFFYHIPAFNEIGFKTITGIAQTIDGATYSQYEIFAAFTVAELGVMLPVKAGDAYLEIDVQNTLSGVFICRIFNCISSKTIKNFNSPKEAEARAAMLIYLLENNLTTAAEVNERLKNA